MSATSRQPLSMVSACPRSGHLGDLGHALVALLLLVGGVGDRPRDRVVLLAGDDQQRPAVGVLAVDLRLGPRVEVGGGGLEERRPGGGHGVGVVELLGLVLADRVGEAEAELLVGQRDGAVAVGGVGEDRRRRLQRGDRQRQDAAEGRGIDGHRGGRQAAAGEDLGQQPAEGVPDDRRLALQPADHRGEVVGDLSDGLVGEDLGVGVGLLDRVGVVGPAGRERRVAGLLEDRRPAVPAAGQQPEAVDEDDGLQPGLVGTIDLLGLVLGDDRRGGVGGRGAHARTLPSDDSRAGSALRR